MSDRGTIVVFTVIIACSSPSPESKADVRRFYRALHETLQQCAVSSAHSEIFSFSLYGAIFLHLFSLRGANVLTQSQAALMVETARLGVFGQFSECLFIVIPSLLYAARRLTWSNIGRDHM